jgi:hypothetical protein
MSAQHTRVLNPRPAFGHLAVRKTRAISANAAYNGDLNLEDTLNRTLRLRD